MTKIDLNDSFIDIITKMSEGNPGAITVLMGLLKGAPENVFLVLDLDTLGVYGSRIWMLYKDVCKEDMEIMRSLLFRWQTGKFTEHQINHAIDNYGDGIDITAL